MAETLSTGARRRAGAVRAAPRKRAAVVDKEQLKEELEVERTLGWLFHDIHMLIGQDFESRIRDFGGLTRAQWRVLVTIDRSGGGQTQTELAALTGMEKAPLGKILDRLEERDWITRRDDPEDRRARRVYATSKIEKYFPQLAEAAKAVFARTLKGMRQSEVKGLIDQLKMLKRNLGGADN